VAQVRIKWQKSPWTERLRIREVTFPCPRCSSGALSSKATSTSTVLETIAQLIKKFTSSRGTAGLS
jgi:hypothetical protein